jgi:hypothetical protein
MGHFKFGSYILYSLAAASTALLVAGTLLWPVTAARAYLLPSALTASASEIAGSLGAMKITVSSGSGWCPYDINAPGISSVENGMPDALKISRTARVVGLSGPRTLIPQNSVATYNLTSADKSQRDLSPTKYLPISYARYADLGRQADTRRQPYAERKLGQRL